MMRRVPLTPITRLRCNRAIDFESPPRLIASARGSPVSSTVQRDAGYRCAGYEPLQRELYLKYLAKPQGMILVTGPTGSGRRFRYTPASNILNNEDCNISTAEDPAEINLPGINQVNVNNKVGLTFASALRAFLRQDPDVIMVGEIRDLETAEIAIKAAQTGHLVLSTLHTNDAPQTLTRLVDMGVKPYAIATSVSLIIAQRLARKLCSNCKKPIDIPPEALKRRDLSPQTSTADSQYSGRLDVASARTAIRAVWVSIRSCRSLNKLAALLCKRRSHGYQRPANKDGIWNLRRAGLQKVKDGLTSLEEVNSVTID